MLPQTRETIAALRTAGLKRKQIRVRTPWNRKLQGYGQTRILLLCPKADLLQVAPLLATSFKTIVLCLDGVPMHVSLEPGKGLYLYEQGNYTKIDRLPPAAVETRLVQLSLWDIS